MGELFEQKQKRISSVLSFSATTLKYIAVVAMLIDHIAATILVTFTKTYGDGSGFQGIDLLYSTMRKIGRISFPIFCFFLVEGFFHTKSRKKYIGRLLAFAILSELPYDLALHNKPWCVDSQSVMVTLLLGLLAIIGMDYIRRLQKWSNLEKMLLRTLVAAIFILFAFVLKPDYSVFGVGLIISFYVFYNDRLAACIVGYIILIMEYFSFPAYILLYFYQGKKGRGNKYFFYLFYPIHLLVLYGIRVILIGA